MKRLFVFVFSVCVLLPGVVSAREGAEVRPDFELRGRVSLAPVVADRADRGVVPVDVLGNVEAGLFLREAVDQDLCLEWIPTALDAGWTYPELPKLLRLMFRESRCLPDACGETDSPHVRKCRDWGLMQINDHSWKRIIREMGLSIEQMHDPYWNLWFARWLFEYSVQYNDDGWQPWTPSKW
jgi:hypothetical protein